MGTLSSQYLRKPIEVSVRFALAPGAVDTLEGEVSFQQGDAIVTGTRGETWPIPRQRFERTYEPSQPQGAMGQDGLYRRKPSVVTARQTVTAMSIPLSNGRGVLTAQPGDWIVEGQAGDQWVVADAIFRDTYTRVEQSSGS
jgi:hypothetical protein